MNAQEQLIDDIASEMLTRWVAQRKQRLEKWSDTGALMRSLLWESREVAGAALAYGVQFDVQGRYMDMKRAPAKGISRQQIEDLKKWAGRRIDKLRRGYERKHNFKASDQRIINTVAWGIAKKQADRYSRPRRWYAKAKSGMLDELFDRIAGSMLDSVADELKPSGI